MIDTSADMVAPTAASSPTIDRLIGPPARRATSVTMCSRFYIRLGHAKSAVTDRDLRHVAPAQVIALGRNRCNWGADCNATRRRITLV
jgi:hypothetical protein